MKKIFALIMSLSIISISLFPFVKTNVIAADDMATKEIVSVNDNVYGETIVSSTTTTMADGEVMYTTTTAVAADVSYPYIKPYELTIWCQNTDDYTPIPEMEIELTIIRTTYNDKPEIINIEEEKETINTHGKEKVIYNTNLDFSNRNENYTFVLEPILPDEYRRTSDANLATQLYAFEVEDKVATGTIYINTTKKPKVTIEDLHLESMMTTTTTSDITTTMTTTSMITEDVSYPYIKPYELTIWCQNTDDYTPIPNMEIELTIIRTTYNDIPEIINIEERKETINTQGKENVIYKTDLVFTNRSENYTFVLEPQLPDGYRRPNDLTLGTDVYAFEVENKAATGTVYINTTKKPKIGDPSDTYIPVPEASFYIKDSNITVSPGSSTDVTIKVSQIRSMSFTSDNPYISVDPISEPQLVNNDYNTINIKCKEGATPGKAIITVRFANYLSGVEKERDIEVTILGDENETISGNNEILPQTGYSSIYKVIIGLSAIMTVTGVAIISKNKKKQ